MQLGVVVQCIQHLAMTLQTHEHRFRTRHTSRAGQTIRQAYLRGWGGIGIHFVLSRDFIGIVLILRLLFREGLGRVDARDTRIDEVVQVVGGEDRGHAGFGLPLLGHMGDLLKREEVAGLLKK